MKHSKEIRYAWLKRTFVDAEWVDYDDYEALLDALEKAGSIDLDEGEYLRNELNCSCSTTVREVIMEIAWWTLGADTVMGIMSRVRMGNSVPT